MEAITRDSGRPPSMSRRTLIGAGAVSVAAALAGSSDSSRTVAAQRLSRVRREGVRNVVLVHGAYADGSCWVDAIQTGPAILVSHSSAGTRRSSSGSSPTA